jgi:hypothetical protein
MLLPFVFDEGVGVNGRWVADADCERVDDDAVEELGGCWVLFLCKTDDGLGDVGRDVAFGVLAALVTFHTEAGDADDAPCCAMCDVVRAGPCDVV